MRSELSHSVWQEFIGGGLFSPHAPGGVFDSISL